MCSLNLKLYTLYSLSSLKGRYYLVWKVALVFSNRHTYCIINLCNCRLCGQDIIRSVVFGLCSLLIPVGYGNDPLYYQCPNQSIRQDPTDTKTDEPKEQYQSCSPEPMENGEVNTSTNITYDGEKMRSGTFLIVYTLFNALILSGCFTYMAVTRDLDIQADTALVLPLILAVVPGNNKSYFCNLCSTCGKWQTYLASYQRVNAFSN